MDSTFEKTREDSFTGFVAEVEPKLRHAFVAAVGRDRGREAAAEALAFGWEHWDEVRDMANPAGYLYRVGRSRVRVRSRRVSYGPMPMSNVPVAAASHVPEVEPGLPRALARLTEKQRVVVFLVYGMEWTRREVADLLGISVNSVGSHLDRGLGKLRSRLGVTLSD